MLSQARAAVVSTLFFTLLLGVAFPLAVTGVGKLAFPSQAEGSLIRNAQGEVIGSELIAQPFTKAEYLHPRPSGAGASGYDASGSSGSNLGPMNEDLAKRVLDNARAMRGEGPGRIPADAVTTSGSGLDPDVSPVNARRQAARVALARGVAVDQVQKLIDAHTTGPWLGVFGQPRVNVLKVNLALDAAMPIKSAPSPAAAGSVKPAT